MNKEYPILDKDTPGLINDIINMDDAEHNVNQYNSELSMSESENYDKESFDNLLSAHVLQPRGDGFEHGTAIGRKHDQDCNLVNHGSANPWLSTQTYKVEFQDAYIQEYFANTITENIYAQVVTEANAYILLQDTCNY